MKQNRTQFCGKGVEVGARSEKIYIGVLSLQFLDLFVL